MRILSCEGYRGTRGRGTGILLGVLLCAGTAQAGVVTFTQTLCIWGTANGTNWDYELRPGLGGAPLVVGCSGTGNVPAPGNENVLAVATATALNDCATVSSNAVMAYAGPGPGGDCTGIVTSPPGQPVAPVTIITDSNVGPVDVALQALGDPPGTLTVLTPGTAVQFNPFCQPSGPVIPLPESGFSALLLTGMFGLIMLSRTRTNAQERRI